MKLVTLCLLNHWRGLSRALGRSFKARCFRGFKEQRTSPSRDGGLEAPPGVWSKGERDDASGQGDLEWAMSEHVTTRLNICEHWFVVTGRPGASGRCAETGTSVYASECNEGCAASSPWFWIPHVRCWVAVEDGWGTRPVQILWCLNWQSAVMSKLHESNQIAVPTHQRTKSTWRTPSWLSLSPYICTMSRCKCDRCVVNTSGPSVTFPPNHLFLL